MAVAVALKGGLRLETPEAPPLLRPAARPRASRRDFASGACGLQEET
jgi:hypothetical protein